MVSKKKEREAMKTSTNFICDAMRTDSETDEDNIYDVLFAWILYKYGK